MQLPSRMVNLTAPIQLDLFAGPRERGIADGWDSLSDSEIVAVLLGTGEKGRPVLRVAAELLEQSGGIIGISRLGAHALAQMQGVGLVKAARIAAGFELGRRLLLRTSGMPRTNLASSAEVARWARIRLARSRSPASLGARARRPQRLCARPSALPKAAYTGARSILAMSCAQSCAKRPAASSSYTTTPSGDPTPSQEDIDLRTRSRGPRRCSGLPSSIT